VTPSVAALGDTNPSDATDSDCSSVKYVAVIGVARGAVVVPRTEKKIFRRNLQEKFVSTLTQAEQASILGTFLLGGGDLDGGVVHLVVLACVLRATTKKVVNFF